MILVEPTYLERLSHTQNDPNDHEMQSFLALANDTDTVFAVLERFGLPMLVRMHCSKEQLVIPKGYWQLLLEEHHCTPLTPHVGTRKMLHLMQARVWWPRMRADITKFVANCDICKRTKDPTTQKHGELQPLPIPTRRGESWGIDFITDLPLSNGCNALMTCVDRLGKINKLVPCRMGQNTLTARKVAELFFANVVRQYGVPKTLVHDHDPRFTSVFWHALW